MNQKWYKTHFGVIALLIFFAPLGLYFMWKDMKWERETKWKVTTAVLVFGIVASFLNTINTRNTSFAPRSIPVTATIQTTLINSPTSQPEMPTNTPAVSPVAKQQLKYQIIENNERTLLKTTRY